MQEKLLKLSVASLFVLSPFIYAGDRDDLSVDPATLRNFVFSAEAPLQEDATVHLKQDQVTRVTQKNTSPLPVACNKKDKCPHLTPKKSNKKGRKIASENFRHTKSIAAEQASDVLACNKKDKCPHFLPDKMAAGCLCRSNGPEIYEQKDGHIVNTIQITRKAIILEDSTVWKVKPSDEYKLYNWDKNDFIVVTQNRSWFSGGRYPYLIMNRATRDVVQAYLYDYPVTNGEHSISIAKMDSDNGELMLSNVTYWQLCKDDYHIFKSWLLKDSIVVGVNTGWGSEMPNILINFNTKSFVRAARL